MQIYIKYESFANFSNIVPNVWRYVQLPGACPDGGGVKRWNGFLPNPWQRQKLSCHDNVAKWLRQKTMEARALADRPMMLSWWQEVFQVDKLAKGFKCNS
jgi:hypothetical protein